MDDLYKNLTASEIRHVLNNTNSCIKTYEAALKRVNSSPQDEVCLNIHVENRKLLEYSLSKKGE